MDVKIKGKSYTLELRGNGQIWCRELDIVGDTAKEVEDKIRKAADAPQIKILTFGQRWSNGSEDEYYEGTTRGGPVDRRADRWVSWKLPNGRTDKGTGIECWEDTPENRRILDQMVNLRHQIKKLEEQISNYREKLTQPSFE